MRVEIESGVFVDIHSEYVMSMIEANGWEPVTMRAEIQSRGRLFEACVTFTTERPNVKRHFKRFCHNNNPGFREFSLIAFGRMFQLTLWRGPPHSVYAGIELHWWKGAEYLP